MSKAATKPAISHRKSATGLSDENRKRNSLKAFSHKNEHLKSVTDDKLTSKQQAKQLTLTLTQSPVLAPQPSPLKAEEEMTSLLPTETTTVDSPPGPMSLSMTLGPTGFETGRSILGELPLNHKGIVRPAMDEDLPQSPSPATQQSPPKAAETMSLLLPTETTTIGSPPGSMSLSMTLAARGVDTGRFKGAVRPAASDGRATVVSTATSEQKLIDSGIVRIRATSLDAHGYRKLQSLITNRPDLWQDRRYDELFQALLCNLEAIKEHNGAASVLKTVRLMIAVHPVLAQPILTQAMCTFLLVRGYYRNHTHIADELEDIARDVVDMLEDAVPLTLSIVRLLENCESRLPMTLVMALQILFDVVHRGILLAETDIWSITNILQILICDGDVTVRKYAMACLVEVFGTVTSPTQFWEKLTTLNPADKNLLVYYLAARVGAA